VHIVHAEDAVIVRVTDSGPGIEPAIADMLFDRGISTKAGSSGGRGIGLSLVRLICTKRGGTVDVSQEEGTVFRVRLPIRSSEVA
jgi:signal transduction histidine kinase